MGKEGRFNFVLIALAFAVLSIGIISWNYYLNFNIQLGPLNCIVNSSLPAEELNGCGGKIIEEQCMSKEASENEESCLSYKYTDNTKTKSCCIWNSFDK